MWILGVGSCGFRVETARIQGTLHIGPEELTLLHWQKSSAQSGLRSLSMFPETLLLLLIGIL